MQTLPQDFLSERYQTPGKATDRLRFLANNLGTLAGTDYKNWKLMIAQAPKLLIPRPGAIR